MSFLFFVCSCCAMGTLGLFVVASCSISSSSPKTPPRRTGRGRLCLLRQRCADSVQPNVVGRAMARWPRSCPSKTAKRRLACVPANPCEW